jgi:hypothetical protein
VNALRRWLSAVTALGVVAALGLVLSGLALIDIGHGEADLRLEWWVVRIAFLAIAIFVATVFVTLGKVRRATGGVGRD